MRRADRQPPTTERGGLFAARLRTSLLVAAVLAGATAEVDPEAARWFGLRGPVCPLGACLGPLACPGCGLVRGVAASLQGDLAAGAAAHPAGPAIAVLLVAALGLHLHILRRGHEGAFHTRWRRRGQRLFAGLVLLGWILRLAT